MSKNGIATRPNPEWIVARAFGATIILGAVLLSAPFSTSSGKWLSFLDALFMSTSATCVTGLAVLDPGSVFSLTGQIILLLLMQAGGIGIMTLSTFFLVSVGRRISVQDEFVLMDSLGHEGVRGLTSLLRATFCFTLVIEALGALIVTYCYATHYAYALPKACYYGAFHSIAAFCNAGFSLHFDSLISFQGDKLMLLTIAGLIVLGGLGFPVLYNLISIRFWRRNLLTKGRLSLHTKVVLGMTLVLILLGWAAFLYCEWHRSLAGIGWSDKLVCSLFQSIAPRTAGFNVVDMSKIAPSTLSLTSVLMFIGGSPASTAGGIKVTTLFVLILTVWAMIRGRAEIQTHQRTIPTPIVRECLVIFVLALCFVGSINGLLLVTESFTPVSPDISQADSIFFETVSAFGTVGLSTGITPMLSPVGKLCIILAMFVGRLGPLTIALLIGRKNLTQVVRYPDEEIAVG